MQKCIFTIRLDVSILIFGIILIVRDLCRGVESTQVVYFQHQKKLPLAWQQVVILWRKMRAWQHASTVKKSRRKTSARLLDKKWIAPFVLSTGTSAKVLSDRLAQH